MKLTHSARFDYSNWYGKPAHCWLRVYEDEDRTPVVIATEMSDNKGVSVTNYAEELATAVRCYWKLRNLFWVEHYPARVKVAKEEFDLVSFRRDHEGIYKEPEWFPISKRDVEAMIGMELEDISERVQTECQKTQ